MAAGKYATTGFILLDVMAALLFFSIGFFAVLSLNNAAALAQARAENYLQAVNLAASAMDRIVGDLEAGRRDADAGAPNDEQEIGKFTCRTTTEQEAESILRITVEIGWEENKRTRNYILQCLCDMGRA